MLERLKWALRVLRTRSYVVLTDTRSVVNIPMFDQETLDDQMILAAQTASLENFKTRLEDLIREHKEAVSLLSYRQKQARAARQSTVSKAKARKHTN